MYFLVTGSCGFIGTNLCLRLIKEKHVIYGIDNFSRNGVKNNFELLKKYRNYIHIKIDISNFNSLFNQIKKIKKIEVLFHLAGQVAVTTSYIDRRKDFATNAIGSFNVIECIKLLHPNCYCIYSSSNKVFGKKNFNLPVSDKAILDPYTPYGVSKAVGDLYFKEYSNKEIGLKTCVLRQSCIYGTHQYGIEDQGWLAWFMICNILRKEINLYGNGSQIRDVLFIDDLIDLYIKLVEQKIVGSFPVGGGKKNSLTVKTAIKLIEEITNIKFVKINFHRERAGDQKYFVSDLSWIKKNKIKWQPKYSIILGLKKLYSWAKNNQKLLSR